VSYPGEEEEARVLELHSKQIDLATVLREHVAKVTNAEQILLLIQTHAMVRVEPKLLAYINRIVRATRSWPSFHMGASPRAGLAMVQGARTLAAFRGRDFAVPDDVAEIALPSLRHRVIMSAEAEVEGLKVDSELTSLLRNIEVPRS
jgi:MoxR-like ATPase